MQTELSISRSSARLPSCQARKERRKNSQSCTILLDTTTVHRGRRSKRQFSKLASRRVIATTDLMPTPRRISTNHGTGKRPKRGSRNGEKKSKEESKNTKRLNRESMMPQTN